jgi:hypothetical protein
MDSKAFYDKTNGIATGYFNGFITSDKFKHIADELHDLRKNNKSVKQLNNIENMKVLTPEVQKWLNDIWFPKAKKTGLKYFAFVIPKDIFGKASMENANKNDKVTEGIEIQYFPTETDAISWLNTK